MRGTALLVHKQSPSSAQDCVFLHHILEIKVKWVNQVLDGGDNNGRTPIIFYNYYLGTLITGILIEPSLGAKQIEQQFWTLEIDHVLQLFCTGL